MTGVQTCALPIWHKCYRAELKSERGKQILDNFEQYLPKFKKIIPNDYKKMLSMIVQMEEKGMNTEQAQIEAFYAIKRG